MTDFDIMFEAKVKKYTPMFWSFINKTWIDNHDDDDLLQEAHFVLLNVINTFDKDRGASFSTYLYTSLRNRFANMIQKQTRDKRPDLLFVSANSPLLLNEVYEEEEDTTDDEKLMASIMSHLKDLPRGYVTYLHFIGGFTMQEIADMEGITKQRVSYLNKRNIERLRELVKC